MRHIQLLLFSIFVTTITLPCIYADDSIVLPGSLHGTSEEVSSASDIVLGKFTEIGGGAWANSNGTHYHGKLAVSEDLKGKLMGSLNIHFAIGGKESVPNQTDVYIVILMDGQWILKLLPASAENVAQVKALIASAHSAK